MASKNFYLNKIKELEFQRDVKINQDNRTHTSLIASISIFVILFMFEISKIEKRIGWIVILGVLFLILIWAINREIHYPENEKIQRNYDVIMGRKK